MVLNEAPKRISCILSGRVLTAWMDFNSRRLETTEAKGMR